MICAKRKERKNQLGCLSLCIVISCLSSLSLNQFGGVLCFLIHLYCFLCNFFHLHKKKKKKSAMEGSLTPELDTKESSIEISKPETQASKRRKVIEKTVVTVKIEGNGGKQKNEGPPSDFWSWRKYGQKPIKGSPYPRGYYRCSTSKGCSAKKQVERSRTDASLLIITYTSTHNHPGPDLPTTTTTTNSTLERENPQIKETPIEETPNQEQQQQPSSMGGSDEETSSEEHFYYLQSSSKDIMINTSTMNQNPFSIDFSLVGGLVFDEHPLSYHHHHPTIPTKSEEEGNDFFDELEELPISSSSFNSFMRTSLFDERILLQPS